MQTYRNACPTCTDNSLIPNVQEWHSLWDVRFQPRTWLCSKTQLTSHHHGALTIPSWLAGSWGSASQTDSCTPAKAVVSILRANTWGREEIPAPASPREKLCQACHSFQPPFKSVFCLTPLIPQRSVQYPASKEILSVGDTQRSSQIPNTTKWKHNPFILVINNWGEGREGHQCLLQITSVLPV